MGDIEKACGWAVGIASDPAHGYDQPTRTGGTDYDCSSLVQAAYRYAGYPMPAYLWTGNMRAELPPLGYQWHAGMSGIQRGDILWKPGHTAIYLGDGYRVEAWMNENHGAAGGRPGDQTGDEIRVHWPYDDDDFTGYFRPPENKTANTTNQEEKEQPLQAIIKPNDENRLVYFDGQAVHNLTDPDQVKALQMVAKQCGAKLPVFAMGTRKAPWFTRLTEALR